MCLKVPLRLTSRYRRCIRADEGAGRLPIPYPPSCTFAGITSYAEALAPVERNGQQMFDARALHGWLGAGRDFSNWFKGRVKEYGFEEGTDFSPVLAKTKGRSRKDYLLTIDTAKELAMVERTEIGRETRRYFIRMERAAMQMASDHVANVIPLFAFNDHQLRGIKIDGKPWFVAADVCRILSIHIRGNGKVNASVAVQKLDADEKGTYQIGTASGDQQMLCVSRPGLFKLIQRSNKPEAKKVRVSCASPSRPPCSTRRCTRGH